MSFEKSLKSQMARPLSQIVQPEKTCIQTFILMERCKLIGNAMQRLKSILYAHSISVNSFSLFFVFFSLICGCTTWHLGCDVIFPPSPHDSFIFLLSFWSCDLLTGFSYCVENFSRVAHKWSHLTRHDVTRSLLSCQSRCITWRNAPSDLTAYYSLNRMWKNLRSHMKCMRFSQWR